MKCIYCAYPLKNLKTLPLCEICNSALLDCPTLCKQCGGLLCRETVCLYPWRKSSVIESYSARYLLLGESYPILKKWKIFGGRSFDRRILRPNDSLLNTWKEFRAEAIVPIPQRINRQWQMRGSRVEQIAKWVQKETQLPLLNLLYFPHPFRQKFNPEPKYKVNDPHRVIKTYYRQAELNLQNRLENRILFEVNLKNLRSFRRVILVDDFMTTGKTMRTAATLLKDRGLEGIHVFCLGIRGTRNI